MGVTMIMMVVAVMIGHNDGGVDIADGDDVEVDGDGIGSDDDDDCGDGDDDGDAFDV